MTDADLPKIMIVHPSKKGVDKFPYTGDLATVKHEDIAAFVSEWKDGKVKKHLKSADVPESQDGPVTIVVGKNFDEVVMNNDNDVLIEFYAPWCGHCKKLAPIYDELGEKTKSIKGLTIAKMDSTENEVDGVSVQGFPTLKFYPTGSKDAPLEFDGERTLEGMTAYLEKHSINYKEAQKDADL